VSWYAQRLSLNPTAYRSLPIGAYMSRVRIVIEVYRKTLLPPKELYAIGVK